MKVEYFKHCLGEEEIEELRHTLNSGYLAYGPKTRTFEKEFSSYLDVPYTVGLNCCTNALFLCQKALGIGPGDEVITTPYTFAATSNSILHTGATHVFADVDPMTGNLDLARVEEVITERTRAIVVVHLYGQMVDMEAFKALADKHGIYLIEDAAHCLEGSFKGHRPGQLGTAAAFSFYATKNITSGEGGALVTRDKALADKVRLLAHHGVKSYGVDRKHEKFKPWDVEALGYKAIMSDIQSSLLLPQLRRIDSTTKKLETAYQRYLELIRSKCLDYVSFPKQQEGQIAAHYLFPIWCSGTSREGLISYLIKHDIGIGIHYLPVHLTTYYATTFGYKSGAFPVTEDLGSKCLSLPFFVDITPEQQAYVVDKIADFYNGQKQEKEIKKR